jgi:hypothetical protein
LCQVVCKPIGCARTSSVTRACSTISIGRKSNRRVNMLDLPQYQMTCFTPLLESSAYTAGKVGYRLCAGRLIEPRMVPPCPEYVSPRE